MRPKKAPKTAVGAAAEKKVEHQHEFPGLAIPDSKPLPLEPSPPRKRSQSPPSKSSRRDDDDDLGRDRRRSYDDDRGRRDSRGGRDERDRRRDDYDDRDRRDGHRHGDRRERKWEDDRHRDSGGGRAGMPPPPVSKDPQLYAVYRGNCLLYTSDAADE